MIRTEPAAIVRKLVEKLAAQDVRYGVYKNVKQLTRDAAGDGDFDLIVDPEDREGFLAAMDGLCAIKGTCHPLYDNAVPGREDWFVPDPKGTAVHLDVSFGLRIGPKFHKHYLALDHADIAEWQTVNVVGAQIPVVSPREAARIAILRAIFRLPAYSVTGWVWLDRVTAGLINSSAPPGAEIDDFIYQIGDASIACPVRRSYSGFEIPASAVRAMRSAVRSAAGYGVTGRLLLPAIDPLVSGLRKAAFAIGRRLTRGSSTRDISKRRLLPRGAIIALIGPDGVGKSTQARRLREVIGRKFRCDSVYLGSNDGAWMAWRGRLRRAIFKLRGKRPKPVSALRHHSGKPLTYRHALGKAIWRLVVGVQRLAAMRRCRRLARRGVVVICDRWPQNLHTGYMDGPSNQPLAHMRLPSLLWTIESRLYARMARHKPDVTIHLDCDFATSNARKPGDITAEGFAVRLALMEEMRALDPHVKIVDARQDRTAVTADIVYWVRLGIHQLQSRQQLSGAARQARQFMFWAACVSIGDALRAFASIAPEFAT
ncbi:Thymidylate kinase [Porphyrobacter sp. LM 6]|nr:Thymidylate kinase [Porphyrobacter sp. LM 6]